MITDKDREICTEMFRRTYGCDIGTREANTSIGRPQADQYGNDLGTYWVDQVEWVATGGWAYWLVYSDDCRARYRGLPDDLHPSRGRSAAAAS